MIASTDIRHVSLTSTMAEALKEPADAGSIELYWLGQAGFLLRTAGAHVLVDPYLSDVLARKYAGRRFPHQRMMPSPLVAAALPPIDWVLCTHGHTDHMDPETLGYIAARDRDCGFVVPEAERAKALERGIPAERMWPMRGRLPDAEALANGQAEGAWERRRLLPGLAVTAIPAAHETLERDASGAHYFLGYVLEIAGIRIYHSGDCVPYAALAPALRRLAIDIALLPINGRDAYRAAHGVPGNFTMDEAVSLCAEAGIDTMVGHHFGMFAENTVSARDMSAAMARHCAAIRWLKPDVSGYWVLRAEMDVTRCRLARARCR